VTGFLKKFNFRFNVAISVIIHDNFVARDYVTGPYVCVCMCVGVCVCVSVPLELHLTTSELWFGQEQEGILP